MQDEQDKKPKAKKDPAAEPNNAARLRAGKRSSNKNAGKNLDEGLSPASEPVPEAKGENDETPAAEAKTTKPEENVAPPKGDDATEVAPEEGFAEGGEVDAEPKAEEAAEPKAEEKAEGSEEPKTAIEQFAAEESKEPQHAQKYEPVGEYTPPETGASHEEHLDAYHNALMYGDAEGAKQHYGALREHQFAEDSHRRKAEDQEKQQGDEYEQAANEVHAAYPHLNLHEDNVESDKIMALAHVYQSHGEAPGAALRKAAHELHGAKPAPAEQGFSEGGQVETTPMTDETPGSEETSVAQDQSVEAEPKADNAEAPALEKPQTAEAKMIPDMEARKLRKKEIAEIPTANARTEPKKEEKKEPTRMDAIERMKKARGQA